jgi:DNA-binding response OmpR family regulator
MAGERILVVEDEPGVLDLAMEVMRSAREGYVVEGATDARSGLEAIRRRKPDLVLLDLNLGRRFDGLELCKRIRSDPATTDIAVVILTGEVLEGAESMLLDAGADDYIRKPHFTPQLLESRVRAVLRRTLGSPSATVTHGPLALDPARREVRVGDRPVHLSPTEFDILYQLARHPDRALARRELLELGHHQTHAIDRTIDVHVLSIRRKLGEHQWLIQTVFGVGYRLGTSATAPPD